MEKKELCSLIKEVFGKYSIPGRVAGHLREPWQDRLEKVPLEQLSSEEIYWAIRHVFPGNYGDKNVFCYILNRLLMYFVDDIDELWIDEIKVITGERCAQWKTQLSPQEIDVIIFVFQYASFKEYYSSEAISSFYFIFFLLWYRDIEVVLSYFNTGYSKQAVDALKYDIQYIIEYYQNIPDMSPLAAILGAYYLKESDEERIDDDTKYKWFHESIQIFEIYMPNYFSPIEMEAIDKKIRGLFM
jgi:hypothetical protein